MFHVFSLLPGIIASRKIITNFLAWYKLKNKKKGGIAASLYGFKGFL